MCEQDTSGLCYHWPMSALDATPDFETSSQALLERVQEAFREILAEAGCDNAQTAAELQRQLGLDKKLGWQVFRVVQAPSPMTAGFAIPPLVSTRRLIAAARDHGARELTGDRLADLVSRFERFVRENAESRGEFESIIADWAPDGRESVELANRRDFFGAISRLRGMACQTTFYTFITHPSEDGKAIDRVLLHGYWGIRRLNSSVRMLADYLHSQDAGAGSQERTLDGAPVTDPGGILMPEFCSQPLPSFETSVGAPGQMIYWMNNNDIGSRSAVEVVFGMRRSRITARYRTPERPTATYFVTPATPTQRVIFDCAVHHDLLTPAEPRVFAHETAASGPVGTHQELARREPDLLDWRPSARSLGQGVGRLRTRFVPRYVEMLTQACERAGWNPDEFVSYRVEVEYPVHSWQISMAFDKGDAPA